MRALSLICSGLLVYALSQRQSTPNGSRNTELATRSSWIFNPLNAKEIASVSYFLSKSDELKASNGAKFDTIAIELHPVPKLAAIAYLENFTSNSANSSNNSTAAPERFAVATIVRYASRDIMKYKVGPLRMDGRGLDPSTASLTNLTLPGQIDYRHRPYTALDYRGFDRILIESRGVLAPLLNDMLGHDGSQHIDYSLIPMETAAGLDRISLLATALKSPLLPGSESYLFPLPLSFKVNHTATDPAEFQAFDYEYCSQGPFPSAVALARAYSTAANNDNNSNQTAANRTESQNQPPLQRCGQDIIARWRARHYNANWSYTHIERPPRPGSSPLPGPRTFMPSGNRFSIQTAPGDEGSGFRVTWQGWDFHGTLRGPRGLALYDVRFLGERILYELSVQDQVVVYSGYGPRGNTVYLDSFYRLGSSAGKLTRGKDCPEYAEYLTLRVQGQDLSISDLPDALCVFERDNQETAWFHHHFTGGVGRPSGADSIRSSSLILRTIATLGNYDYIYDIALNLDGSIAPRVMAAGYMFTAFASPDPSLDAPFGVRIAPGVTALLHDHVTAWKVDLDILGPTRNVLEVTELRSGTYAEALATNPASSSPSAATVTESGSDPRMPGWAPYDEVRYLRTRTYGNETAFLVNPAAPVVIKIASANATNANGYRRSYAIELDASPHQLLRTAPILRGLAWTQHSVAVTVRRDAEEVLSDALLDTAHLAAPVTTFASILNGEALDVESGSDLVAWVTTGFLHVPRSEDVPVISNHASSFMIKPVNYFERLASLDVPDPESPSPTGSSPSPSEGLGGGGCGTGATSEGPGPGPGVGGRRLGDHQLQGAPDPQSPSPDPELGPSTAPALEPIDYN